MDIYMYAFMILRSQYTPDQIDERINTLRVIINMALFSDGKLVGLARDLIEELTVAKEYYLKNDYFHFSKEIKEVDICEKRIRSYCKKMIS